MLRIFPKRIFVFRDRRNEYNFVIYCILSSFPQKWISVFKMILNFKHTFQAAQLNLLCHDNKIMLVLMLILLTLIYQIGFKIWQPWKCLFKN